MGSGGFGLRRFGFLQESNNFVAKDAGITYRLLKKKVHFLKTRPASASTVMANTARRKPALTTMENFMPPGM